jgi:hypothetical protein
MRELRLAGVKVILCGALVVLGGFNASAQNAKDCPVYPLGVDQPGEEIVGTDCYYGHDEPTVVFYSTLPNSASNVTWRIILPTEKTADATNTYNSNTPNPTQTYQLYLHHQFYLVLCNPDGVGGSTPSAPVACTPNSDTNIGTGPGTVGSSILELKFIPPGEPSGGFNCSNQTTTRWCAIAQIQIDNGCAGSPHFNEAYITLNGRPPQPVYQGGPPAVPAPANVFLMNQGDTIRVTLADTANGLLISIVDETTHTAGFLLTNAANGFQSPNAQTCTAAPFTYRPLWNTATSNPAHGYTPFNSFLNVAWGPEIGHSEVNDGKDANTCSTTTNTPSGTWCFPNNNDNSKPPKAIGDGDVDGASFQAANWPPSATGPGSAVQVISSIGTGFGPVTSGQLYPQLRFVAGAGQGIPDAQNAAFYPYFSVVQPPGNVGGQGCALVLGNFAQGSNNSLNDFGKLAQYGLPNLGAVKTRVTDCGF